MTTVTARKIMLGKDGRCPTLSPTPIPQLGGVHHLHGHAPCVGIPGPLLTDDYPSYDAVDQQSMAAWLVVRFAIPKYARYSTIPNTAGKIKNDENNQLVVV